MEVNKKEINMELEGEKKKGLKSKRKKKGLKSKRKKERIKVKKEKKRKD